jgi:hypothetical protein
MVAGDIYVLFDQSQKTKSALARKYTLADEISIKLNIQRKMNFLGQTYVS